MVIITSSGKLKAELPQKGLELLKQEIDTDFDSMEENSEIGIDQIDMLRYRKASDEKIRKDISMSDAIHLIMRASAFRLNGIPAECSCSDVDDEEFASIIVESINDFTRYEVYINAGDKIELEFNAEGQSIIQCVGEHTNTLSLFVPMRPNL